MERFVLAFALIFPTAAAYGYFVAAEPGGTGQFLYSASKCLQFGLPVAYWLVRDPRQLRPGRPSATGVRLGVAFGLLVVAFLAANYWGWFRSLPLAGEMAEKLRAKVSAFGIATPAAFLALAVFVSILHSALEEYYWRWFVHAGLRRSLSFAPAVLLSSLGFMGHHVLILNEYLPGRFWSVTVPLSLGIAVGGAVWAWLYERSKSLVGPWLSHLIIDAGLMLVGYDLMFSR